MLKKKYLIATLSNGNVRLLADMVCVGFLASEIFARALSFRLSPSHFLLLSPDSCF